MRHENWSGYIARVCGGDRCEGRRHLPEVNHFVLVFVWSQNPSWKLSEPGKKGPLAALISGIVLDSGMRGVCDRRAIAILTKARGPGSWCQSFSFSSGRGRGRGDGEDPPLFGVGGRGWGSGIGEGTGVGRGRGSVILAPPFVSTQPPPFKPFKLGPTESRPNSTAETPAPSQQAANHFPEAGNNSISESQFEDAVREKPFKPFRPFKGATATPLEKESLLLGVSAHVPPGATTLNVNQGLQWNDGYNGMQPSKGSVRMDNWETRPRLRSSSDQHRAAQEGSGRGLPLGTPKSPPSFNDREKRVGGMNAEKARASVWGSLSQILASPGKPAVQTTPPSPSQAAERTKEQNLLDSRIKVSTPAEVSQSSIVVDSETKAQLSDESYVAMIKWHQQAGRVADVDQIYEEMKADGVTISIPTFNLLIEVYSQAGQFEKMDVVYNQMRQTLMKPKKESVASRQASGQPLNTDKIPSTIQQVTGRAAPDLEPQSVDQVDESASVTHSDQLSPKLGEWDSPTSEIAETLVTHPQASPLEQVTPKPSPLLGPPIPAIENPESLTPGKLFAQRLETETRNSFRVLPRQPPPSELFEESPKVGALNPFSSPAPPPPGVAGRGRGALSPEVGGVRAGQGRGARQGAAGPSRGPPQAPLGTEPMEKTEDKPINRELSREQARERAMALLGKTQRREAPAERRASPPSPSSPLRSLSREDAVQRAVAVMEEGIQKNQSLEGERRKRGGSAENFSEAAYFVANRFRRRSTSEQATGTQSEKDRLKRQPRSRQRRSMEDDGPQVPQTLREMTEEDEKRLMVLEEEEQFKSALHSKFLVDFEPQYAMEYFGFNPDIDDTPQLSLQETIAQAKPFVMVDDMTDGQWQEEVQGVLEKAPLLEKLVELYAGPNQLTARQQNQKLQAIADTLPTHVAPEMTDFMQKALLTLKSNPGIRLKEKERLMNKFVSGLSSF